MLNYQSFLLEEFANVQVDTYKKNLFLAIGKQSLNESEYDVYETLVVYGNVDRLYEIVSSEDANQDALLESYIEEFIAEESILAKSLAWAERKKKQLADGGKAVLNKLGDGGRALLQAGGNILKPLQMILKKIANGVKNVWQKTLQFMKGQISKKVEEELMPRVNAKFKDDPSKFMEELKSIKEIGAWGVKYCTGGITGDLAKAADKAGKAEESLENIKLTSFSNILEASMYSALTQMIERKETTVEETIEELSKIEKLEEGGGESDTKKIPFISTLMDKIGHTPPFSWFHKMGEVIGDRANDRMSNISAFISKYLGAPGPFTYAAIGGIVAAIAGYLLEDAAKAAIKKALHLLIGTFAPWLKAIFTIIKWTGIALLAYGLIKAIILKVDPSKKKELGEDPKDGTEDAEPAEEEKEESA